MPRALVIIIAALLVSAGTAAAKPKKGKTAALACSSDASCARKCSAKNGAACDRLARQLDNDLESWRNSPTIHAHQAHIHAPARVNLLGACKAKQPRSCVLLGRLEEQGLGGVADVASAEARFSKACDDGEPAGCIALGNAYKAGSFGGKVPKLAYAAYEKGCKAGSQNACAETGLMKADGSGTERDLEGGIDIIEEACIKKSPEACFMLGSLTEHGFGSLDGGAAEAKKFELRACELGKHIACISAAKDELDISTKAGLYERDCQHGYELGCNLAASLVRPDDPARALAFEERACALGDRFVCSNLAGYYKTGMGTIAKDRGKYLGYLDATCDADVSAYECVIRIQEDLPEVVYDEETGAASLVRKPKKGQVEKVIARFVKLCESNVYGCIEASDLLSSGIYIKPDMVRARKLAQQACDAEADQCSRVEGMDAQIKLIADQAACAKDDLQACMRWGSAEWLNPKAARAALDKACTGGIKDACYSVAHTRVYQGETAAYDEIMGWCREGVLTECQFIGTGGGDPAQVLEANRKSCDLGYADGCAMAGYELLGKNDAQALTVFDRACAIAPGTDACVQAAKLREAAQIVAEDAACKAGKAATCVAVGDRLRATKPVEALAAFDRACTAKNAEGCYGAGLLRTSDPTRATQDLQKACDLGSLDGCKAAGGMWLQAGDQAKAKVALTKACLGGKFADACEAAAPLWRADAGDKDHKELFAVLDRGCAFGNAAMCEERQYPNGRPQDVGSSYTPSRGWSPPRRRSFQLRLQAGGFQLSPESFEAYKGGTVGAGVRTRRALGGGGTFGAVVDLRAAVSYDEQSDLGYDGNGALGLSVGGGSIGAEFAVVVGYDAIGEDTTTTFGLEPAYYYGWEGRGRLTFGQYVAGVSYAKVTRAIDDDVEKRLDFTLDRRNQRGGSIGLGVRTVGYDGATLLGAFLRIER